MAVDPLPCTDAVALEAALERHGRRSHALIEVLHEVQLQQGFLSPAALQAVARGLALPLSRVQGVASFYHWFALQPPARHRCAVCLGTACVVRGAGRLLAALEQRLGLPPGGRSADGAWTLQALSCIGACSQAPLLLVDDRLAGALPPDDPAALADRFDALALPQEG